MVKNTNVLNSRKEIQQFNINETEPFKQEEVIQIIQEYSLPKIEEVRCSFLKGNKNKKCNTPHQSGFIVQKSNGEFAFLGNECSNYFAKEGDIKKQIVSIRNERNREIKFGVLLEYEKNTSNLYNQLTNIREELNKWLEKLDVIFLYNTAEFNSILLAGIKQGQILVSLNGIKYERNKQGDTTNKIESKITINIGVLKGLNWLNEQLIKSLRSRIVSSLGALKEIQNLVEKNHNIVETKIVNDLSYRLNDIKNIENDYKNMLEAKEAFFSNDLRIATMLFSNTQSKENVIKFLGLFNLFLEEDIFQIRKSFVEYLKVKHKVDAIQERK